MCLWVFGIENGNHDGRGGAERWNYWVIWTRAIPIHTWWFQRCPISIQSSPALLFLVYWEMCVLHKGVLGNRFCSWLYSSGIWWAILFGMRQRSGMKSEEDGKRCGVGWSNENRTACNAFSHWIQSKEKDAFPPNDDDTHLSDFTTPSYRHSITHNQTKATRESPLLLPWNKGGPCPEYWMPLNAIQFISTITKYW